MSDDGEHCSTVEEPSAEDFEAAADERPQAGAEPVLLRILKSIGVLFVVVALLLYLVSPFYNTFTSVPHGWPAPRPRARQIPVVPEPTSTPLRQV